MPDIKPVQQTAGSGIDFEQDQQDAMKKTEGMQSL